MSGGVNILDCNPTVLGQIFGSGASVEYLCGYLTELGVGALLVENHYVDRHHLDAFADYYAKSFNPPSAHCQRVHFFANLDASELGWLANTFFAIREHRANARDAMQTRYKGFVVRRPLEGAFLGRTVLATYPVAGRRHYTVVRPYRVNVSGIDLVVQGLAYQQQDQGAAVCASTSLWSALQRVAYVSGNRTPTPSQITRAARSPYPASGGLSEPQMAQALSELGYVADCFFPDENRALFRALVATSLDSQLPVVLTMYQERETGAGRTMAGHAVTLTGYSEPPATVHVPTPIKNQWPIPMKAGSLDIVYAHDDNLGSHAHYELFDSTDLGRDGNPKLMLRRGRLAGPPLSGWEVDEWQVAMALVPKPGKVRLALSSLFNEMLSLRPALQSAFPDLQCHYRCRIASGTDYRRQLLDLDLDPAQLAAFQTMLRLPRHIGIVSAYDADLHLVDVVLDVSQVSRIPAARTVLAIISPSAQVQSRAATQLAVIARNLRCFLATGAATAPATTTNLPAAQGSPRARASSAPPPPP